MGRYYSRHRQTQRSSIRNQSINNLTVAGTSSFSNAATFNSVTANGSSALRGNVTVGLSSANSLTVASSSVFSGPVEMQGTVLMTSTGALRLPSGTNVQRPVGPIGGMIRFNTAISNLEFWNGSTWTVVGTGTGSSGGATGAGEDKIFYENQQLVTGSYVLSPGFNAVSAGPIRIANGVTVTIPSGAGWAIV